MTDLSGDVSMIDVSVNVGNATEIFTGMDNATEILTRMDTATEIFTEMDNATEILTRMDNVTKAFTEMDNITEILTRMDNVTETFTGISNATETFTGMSNVTDMLVEPENFVGNMAQVMSIILICTGVAIILINIFVISIFMKHKWMRSNANIIICSMAVTDLLAGMVTISAGIVKWTDSFHVPSLVCRLLDTMDSWISMASLAHVLAVNADRYFAIVFPLKYKYLTSASRIRLILLGIWIVTLVEAILYTIAIPVGDRCTRAGIKYPGLAFVVALLGIALPVVTVVVMYIHIVVAIVRKLHFMAKSSNSDETALAQSQRKMMGTVSTILAAWIICWGPIISLLLLRTAAKLFDIKINMGQYFIMIIVFELLAYCNSLFNPILYFITSRDFRKAGNELCSCKLHKRQDTSTSGMHNAPITKSTSTSATRF